MSGTPEIRARWVPGGDDLAPMLMVRNDVFVTEQGFPGDSETDRWDGLAWHLIVHIGDEPAATARLYADDEHQFHAGRIAVKKAYRGLKLGDLLMRMILLQAHTLGAPGVHIGSQLYVVPFYGKYGFLPVGEDYLDENVPHRPLFLSEDELARRVAAMSSCANCGGCKKEGSHA